MFITATFLRIIDESTTQKFSMTLVSTIQSQPAATSFGMLKFTLPESNFDRRVLAFHKVNPNIRK